MAYGQSRYSRGRVTNSNPPTLGIRDAVGLNYEETYEAARQHSAPTRGRSSTRLSTGGGPTYNIRRNESMRASRGRESMKQLTEALDAKIGVGLKEVEDALNQIVANKTLKAVTLLVTTRTMGFWAIQIYFQTSAQRNPVYCNIYAFYHSSYTHHSYMDAPQYVHTDVLSYVPVPAKWTFSSMYTLMYLQSTCVTECYITNIRVI
jgi:hypothetical protein